MEVMEFGQCPIQLFNSPHPQRKLRDASQFIPRLTLADSISAAKSPSEIKPERSIRKSSTPSSLRSGSSIPLRSSSSTKVSLILNKLSIMS